MWRIRHKIIDSSCCGGGARVKNEYFTFDIEKDQTIILYNLYFTDFIPSGQLPLSV